MRNADSKSPTKLGLWPVCREQRRNFRPPRLPLGGKCTLTTELETERSDVDGLSVENERLAQQNKRLHQDNLLVKQQLEEMTHPSMTSGVKRGEAITENRQPASLRSAVDPQMAR